MVFCLEFIFDLLIADHGVIPVMLVFNIIIETFFISYNKTFYGWNLACCRVKPIGLFSQRTLDRLVDGHIVCLFTAIDGPGPENWDAVSQFIDAGPETHINYENEFGRDREAVTGW